MSQSIEIKAINERSKIIYIQNIAVLSRILAYSRVYNPEVDPNVNLFPTDDFLVLRYEQVILKLEQQ